MFPDTYRMESGLFSLFSVNKGKDKDVGTLTGSQSCQKLHGNDRSCRYKEKKKQWGPDVVKP